MQGWLGKDALLRIVSSSQNYTKPTIQGWKAHKKNSFDKIVLSCTKAVLKNSFTRVNSNSALESSSLWDKQEPSIRVNFSLNYYLVYNQGYLLITHHLWKPSLSLFLLIPGRSDQVSLTGSWDGHFFRNCTLGSNRLLASTSVGCKRGATDLHINT